jgi:amino acid transporter
MQKPTQPDGLPARLGLFDAVSIIVGIVVGTSIFRAPPQVFSNVSGPWMGLGLWALGGALSFVGALCYAELATTYPRIGGDYVYLSRAFGRWMGFLFGWAQLTVILTGSIGVMGYAFADYAVPLFALDARWTPWLAAGAVAALTLLNLGGIVFGKAAQNILTVAKVLGLTGIVIAGFLWGDGSWETQQPMNGPGLGLAMVFVLYAYGGWNDAAFVAAEVRHRERNIPLALLLGTTGITLIYLLVNAAYLVGLGFEGVRASSAPAADLMQKTVGPWGGKAISILVMISALGAINGLIFTGARVYAAIGAEHRLFALLGRWSQRADAPVWSLVAQGVVTLGLIVKVGTESGRNAIDATLQLVGLNGLPWDDYYGGFNTLVAGTAPVFWLFFLLTGISLFVLRWKDADLPRVFTTPLYPLTPLVFCATCVYMLYSSLTYAGSLSLIGVVPLAVGLPLYWLSRGADPNHTAAKTN